MRDLAAREQACCAFFAFTITSGDDLLWEATVVDNPTARAVLDGFSALSDTLIEGVDSLHERFTRSGLRFTAPSSHPEKDANGNGRQHGEHQ